MSRESEAEKNLSADQTGAQPEHPKTENNEQESTARALAALERAAGLIVEKDALERRGADRLASIEASVHIPEDLVSPARQRAEAALSAVAAEAEAEMAKSKKALTATIRDWADKHRKAAMFMLASALAHAPVLPQTRAAFEHVVEAVRGTTDWEKPNMVIHPQSNADRKAVTDRMFERGARTDVNAANAYKDQVREKMERGEPVSFKRLYYDMERLGGEDAQEVKTAEEKTDKLIEYYAVQMGVKLDEPFARRVVMERFGSDKDYVWGQGSLTKRMNTGKRNCVSFAREQQVLFEGLIARLPESERSRYEVGLTYEKQHEIATVTVKRADGSIEATYLLQPPVDKIANGTDRAGSPNISLETVKKAMVSKEAIKVVADAKGQEIPSSPDLDVVTDTPVLLNLKIQGKLRGSDYVQEVAEEQGIKPVAQEPERLVGIQELTLEGGYDQGAAFGAELKHRAISGRHSGIIHAEDMTNPSPEAVAALELGAEDGDPFAIGRVTFGDMSKWKKEAFQQLLQTHYDAIDMRLPIDGKMPTAFMEALEEAAAKKAENPEGFRSTHIRELNIQVSEPGYGKMEVRMQPEQLKQFLNAARDIEEIDLGYYSIEENEAEVLACAPQKTIDLQGRNLSAKTIAALGKGKTTFNLHWSMYAENAKDHPEIVKYANISYVIPFQRERIYYNHVYDILHAMQRYFSPDDPRLKKYHERMNNWGIEEEGKVSSTSQGKRTTGDEGPMAVGAAYYAGDPKTYEYKKD